MTATVRSVRVVLEADIAKYVADMKLAGKATREAFGGANGNGTQASWITKAMGEVEQSTKKVGEESRKTSRDVDGLGDSLGRQTRRTKEFSLEQAIAAERASRMQKALRDQARAAVDAEQGLSRMETRTRSTEKEIDRVSGRVRLLGEALFTIGPALIPIGAGLLPALTGVGAAAGAAAGGVGVMLLAFHGVGKAIKALNDYQLEPTKEHLQALNEQMSGLGRSGQRFVRFLDSVSGNLRTLQLIARNRMFPGLMDGLDSILKLMPEAKGLVASLSSEVGKLSAEAGASLAGGGWARFINYLETDAAPTLDALGHTIGNVALGFANLFVDFAPLTRSFTAGIEHASQAFADWTANLSQTQGFQSFLGYVQSEGPQVVALVESIGAALLGIAKAAAPVGNAVLPLLTGLANILAAIANSPIGPALYTTAAAMIAVSRATNIAQAAMLRFGTTSTAAAASSDAAAASAGKLSLAMKGVLVAGAALAAGNTISAGFDKIGGNVNAVGNSLAHGQQSKFRSPAAFLGFNPEHFGDTGPVKKADANLAAAVNAGQGVQAAQQLKKYADAANMSVKEASKQFPLYTAAVQQAQGATAGYNSTLKATYESSQQTTAAVDGLVAAMHNQHAAALAAFDAETQYRQALKDAAAQAKASNAGIRGNSDAALKNRAALSALAAAWDSQSDAVKNSAARARSARQSFIDMATGMGVPIGQARRLAKAVIDIPRSKVAKIGVDPGGSFTVINQVQARLNRLQDRTIHITTIANKIAAGSAGTHLGGKADGGTVPGPRTPYGDKMLTMLAPGEEVISNRYGQADRYRADRAAGRIPGYASGGTVGRGQLAGIGSWASPSELAVRFSNLTVKQLQTLGREMDKLSYRNLKRLGVALDKASSLQEKQTQDAKDAFDAVTQKRTDLTSTISQSLTRDIFGGGGSAFNGQFAAGSVASVNQQLAMQNQDAKDFQRLERILRQRGVTGDALQQILAGGIDRVRTFAAASTGELQTYAQRYNAAYGAHGSVTTAASFGAALLTPEFNALQAAYAEQTAELKAIKAELAKDHKEQQQSRARATRAVRNQPQRARRG